MLLKWKQQKQKMKAKVRGERLQDPTGLEERKVQIKFNMDFKSAKPVKLANILQPRSLCEIFAFVKYVWTDI
jgi:hypothetical protein